jgi:hypothetical protein
MLSVKSPWQIQRGSRKPIGLLVALLLLLPQSRIPVTVLLPL